MRAPQSADSRLDCEVSKGERTLTAAALSLTFTSQELQPKGCINANVLPLLSLYHQDAEVILLTTKDFLRLIAAAPCDKLWTVPTSW